VTIKELGKAIESADVDVYVKGRSLANAVRDFLERPTSRPQAWLDEPLREYSAAEQRAFDARDAFFAASTKPALQVAA
jgi:hypothetical protein